MLSFSVVGQSNWLKSYGNLVNEEILDAATDASGNIISVGYFSGPTTIGSTNMTGYGSSDILVIKTDNAGNVLWSVKAGGSGPDRAYSVSVDNNGNSYITGYFYNAATFGTISVSGADRDVYAAKIDPNGNFLWVQTFGGQYGDTGYGIQVDNVGSVIVTGQYRGNGVFGPDNFTSTIDPNTGAEAYDFFLTKLDGGGNFLWTREANAKYDDRGLALAVDEQNNIYVVGQFSDTITFQNTHNNQSMNAGFLIKYDDAGNEIWFDKYRAAQVILYDVKWSDDNIYLTGDFKGNMQVSHQGGIVAFTAGGEYNILISKLDESGNLTWFSSNFSENEITSKQLALDASNDIYLTGLFKCDFTEMNQIYGNSTFLSLGYRDVHYIKYSNAGIFQWGRQFGSNEDDYCSAIVMNGVDHPVMAGSFENWIIVPTGSSFDFSTCAVGSLYAGTNCLDGDYGSFCRKKTLGNKDIFLVDPFDISRLPLDYYTHTTGCDFDTLAPCILSCQDSIEMCSQAGISVNLHHIVGSADTILHPRYSYLWNTGSINYTISVNTTGFYTVHTERMDGCASYNDTIHVTIHPLPAAPLITDTWGYNFYNPSANSIDTCYVDSLFIYATPADTITQTVTWSAGVYINDSTRYINQSGFYTATATTAFGCTNINTIQIVLDDFAQHDTLDPQIHFTNSHQESSDTLYICSDGTWGHYLLDHNYIDVTGGFPYKQSYWFLDGIPYGDQYYWPDINYSLFHGPPSPGWHTLSAHFVNDCADSVDYYIDRDFYVVVVPDPYVNIIGPTIYGNYCPGDTLNIIVQTSDTTVTWSSPYIVTNWTDSVYAVLSLVNQIFTAYVDTITPYVTCSSSDTYILPGYNSPEIAITGINIHGGIICPGDSLEIVALDGLAWIWIGPQGDTLGTNQNVWVDLPGFYHCIITDNYGCVLTSNFVEAKEYSSPFLQVEPQLICEGETSEITVIANPFTSISWLPPLSGSSTSVTVDTAGIYYCETNFCNITLIDSVIILISIPVAQITAAPNTTICPGDTVTLFANGGMMNYWWNGTHEGESILETNVAGTYVLETENEIGCQTSDTIVINYLSNPQAPVVNDTSICSGNDVLLIATANDSVYWFDMTGLLLGDNDSLLLSNITSTTQLIVKNKDSLCYSLSENVFINIYSSSVTPVISSDSVYCENEVVTLSTTNSGGAFIYSWILPDNSIANSPTLNLGSANASLNGTYSVYYSDINCTSDTVDVNLVINPFPLVDISASPDLIICSGDTVMLTATTNATDIIWSNGLTTFNLTSDSAGIYFYSATLNGCTINSDSLEVIMTLPSSSNGSIDTSICEGNAALLESNSTASVIWFNANMDTVLTGADFITPILNSDTVYYFQITEPGFCPVLEYASITVIQNNYIPSILNPSNICEGDSIAISSGDFGVTDFSWFNSSGELSDSSSMIIDTDSAGTFAYGLVLSFGSCMSDTAYFNLTVNALPETGILALTSTSICQGDSVTLLAQTNATSIVWIPLGETDTLVTAMYEDFYYYYAELNGCYAVSDTVQITFNPTTIFPEISDTIICEGNEVIFILNTSSDVLWADENMDTVGSSVTFNTGVLYDDAAYFYQVNDSGLCPTDWLAVFVNVIETDFTPDFTSVTDLCLGDSILISATNLTAQNYFWLSNGDTVSIQPFVVMIPDGSGNVEVQLVTGSYGCYSDTGFVSVNVNDIPAFDLPTDTVLCINETLIFNTPYDYWIDWYVDDSTGSSADTFAVITFTNNAGCLLIDTLMVSYMDCSLFMPNVFTPDGDGINDVIVFSIEKGDILNLVIQNRWGHILYEGPAGEWDGIDRNGSESVAGTYFYIIEYQHIDGSTGVEQGWFFLQR